MFNRVIAAAVALAASVAVLAQQPKLPGRYFTPVSYTHLDVYKRQTHARPEASTWRTISRIEGNPLGGTTHNTANCESLMTAQPRARSRSLTQSMICTARSMCAPKPSHPAAPRARNRRSPMKRRDHWTVLR